MREIKYKYWDFKDKKTSIMNDNGVFRAVYKLKAVDYWQDCSLGLLVNRHNNEKGILREYTGLTDKNGKKIYEGDIFNCKRDKAHPDGGYYAGTMDYYPESAEVVTFEAGCFLAGSDYLHNRLFWYERHNWDLIGNIYENPELLENNNEVMK